MSIASDKKMTTADVYILYIYIYIYLFLTFVSNPNASLSIRLVILSKWTDSVRPSLLITCMLILFRSAYFVMEIDSILLDEYCGIWKWIMNESNYNCKYDILIVVKLMVFLIYDDHGSNADGGSAGQFSFFSSRCVWDWSLIRFEKCATYSSKGTNDART